jgi:hypothetical protein
VVALRTLVLDPGYTINDFSWQASRKWLRLSGNSVFRDLTPGLDWTDITPETLEAVRDYVSMEEFTSVGLGATIHDHVIGVVDYLTAFVDYYDHARLLHPERIVVEAATARGQLQSMLMVQRALLKSTDLPKTPSLPRATTSNGNGGVPNGGGGNSGEEHRDAASKRGGTRIARHSVHCNEVGPPRPQDTLVDVTHALSFVHVYDLANLRRYKRPPGVLLLVMEAVQILLCPIGHTPNFTKAGSSWNGR